MKDLTEFIQEALETSTIDTNISESESQYKFVKFHFGEEASSVIDKVKSACIKADVYCEDIDDSTIKIKVRKDKDFTNIIGAINDYINSIPEDKKEENSPVIDELNKAISNVESFIGDDDDDNKDDNKDDSKEEE